MTAILILFEMTGDYQIILPLMLAVVVSTILSRAVSEESIYTLKLTRRGVHLRSGKDIDVMQTVSVGEAMTTGYDAVPLEMSLEDLEFEFETTHHHGFPVLDREGKLAGVVTIQDLERAVSEGSLEGRRVEDIATRDHLLVVEEDQPMWAALQKLGRRDIGRLPVVARDDPWKLVGVIRRKDIIQAYNLAIVKRSRHQYHDEVAQLDKLFNEVFFHLEVSNDGRAVGIQIKDLHLPEEVLIVSVHRGRKIFVAHGETELRAGDELTVFARDDLVEEVRRVLVEGGEPA